MTPRRLLFVASALLATLLVPTPVDAWTRGAIRIGEATRYDTAVEISEKAFPTGAPAAVLVNGTNFADGLAAGPLAALQKGPVLLTEQATLPDVVLAELQRLKPTTITVVGGPAAVADEVLATITTATGVVPQRLWGDDRYQTAVQVAALFPAGASTAYVASGLDFPDALAGGAAAALAGVPLLLVPQAEATQPVVDALVRLRPAEVRLLGGEAAVSAAVEAQLKTVVPTVRRIAGADRFATAQALATDGGRKPLEALVATGFGFADALAAAPLAAVRQAPILLATRPCAPQPTVDALRDMGWPDVTIVGGSTVVSANAGNAVPCSPVPDGTLAPGVLLTTQVLPGPVVVHLLTLDRRQGHDVRVVPTTGRVNGIRTVTGTTRQLFPLVGVNGDFFDPKGEPTHALASKGRLLRWPGSLVNSVVGIDPAKTTYAFMGRPKGGADVDLGPSASPLGLGLVNMRAPSGEELALVTPEWTRAFPEGSWCRAVLAPSSAPFIEGAAPERTIQPGTIVSAGCSSEPIPRTADVLVAAPSSAIGAKLAALLPGSTANIRWKLHPNAKGVLDVVGSNVPLVVGGAIAPEMSGPSPFLRPREARTGIGMRSDGVLLIAVVDKGAGWSVGMTPRELAVHLQSMGAVDATNLDGGGSTALSVRGVLANRPSDGAERHVNTALVVQPR